LHESLNCYAQKRLGANELFVKLVVLTSFHVSMLRLVPERVLALKQ
jgi:hypothetical protein